MDAGNFPEPSLLRISRKLLLVSGFLDLIASTLVLGSYFLHPDLPPLQYLALAFQGIHIFSWLGAFVLGSDNLSPWFAILMVTIFGSAFAGDMIAFVIRNFAGASGHAFFDGFVMWTTMALAFVDIFSAVVGYFMATMVERQRRAAFEFSENYVASQSRFDSLFREGIANYYLRTTVLPVMWKLQIFFLGILALMIVFGFNRSPTFTRIAALEIPQAMTWLLLAAISGTIVIFPSDALMNTSWLILSAFVLFPTLIAEIAAWILRLILLLTDVDPLPPPVAPLYQFFGWIQFGLGLILFFITLVEIGGVLGALGIKLGIIVPQEKPKIDKEREGFEERLVKDFDAYNDE